MTARNSKSTTTKRPRPPRRLGPLLVALQLALIGCGGDDLLLPSAGEPSTISMIDGDTQRGTVGQTLGLPLIVVVTDDQGRPVEGVEVRWDAQGGSVSASIVPTGPDGRSAVGRTLGDTPGVYGTTAQVAGLDGSPVFFTSTADPLPDPSLSLTTQPSSSAAAGVPFERQPEIQLLDPFGAPLAREDVRVTVTIGEGTGSIDGDAGVQTDASGRARFSDLAIRGAPGTRRLMFTAEGFTPVSSDPVEVRPGPVSIGRSSADVPNGRAGEETVVSVRLLDQFRTPIEGAAGRISISVSGSNEAAGLSVTDRGNGNYSASYTPVHAGSDQIDVRVNGTRLENSPFTSDVATGPPSPAGTTASVTRTPFIFGYIIDVTVTVRDAQGNLIGHGGDLVQDQPGGGDVRNAQDNGDGTYSDRFFTTDPNISVGITLNGVAIAGSPFTPQ